MYYHGQKVQHIDLAVRKSKACKGRVENAQLSQARSCKTK